MCSNVLKCANLVKLRNYNVIQSMQAFDLITFNELIMPQKCQ